MAQLVRACQGLREAVLAFKAPLISGKDSMKNDFDDGVLRLSILPTLLISGIARVHDIDNCLSMEFKRAGDIIYLLSAGKPGLAGSHFEEISGWQSALTPSLELGAAAKLYKKVHDATYRNWISSAHDLSEGGLAVALAECSIGSGLGCSVNIDGIISQLSQDAINLPFSPGKILSRNDCVIFAEGPGRLLVTVDPSYQRQWQDYWNGYDVIELGVVTSKPKMTISCKSTSLIDLQVSELERVWRTPLPFD
jgi:phosphoribosylformylglycinamidine synthase